MKKIISFSHLPLRGTIVDYSGYRAWSKVPVKIIKIQELENRDAIYAFIKKMEIFLYSNNEIDNLYFFYKAEEVLHTVRYKGCILFVLEWTALQTWLHLLAKIQRQIFGVKILPKLLLHQNRLISSPQNGQCRRLQKLHPFMMKRHDY